MNVPRVIRFGASDTAINHEVGRFPHPLSVHHRGNRAFGVQAHDDLVKFFKFAPSTALADLHTIAVASYIADKHCSRSGTADGWTRRLHLVVPVRDPNPWNGEAGDLLVRLLEFLTSDSWTFEFREGKGSAIHDMATLPDDSEPVTAVSLFSGGLDSFCHNVIATSRTEARRYLVRHAAPPLHVTAQENLSELLPGRRGTLAGFTVEPHKQPEWGETKLELSQRTRTLLFMAAGLLVCDSNGIPVLEVPENGLLALNPPLNASRVGACSTKSVHPLTMHLMNAMLRALGSGVRVENPVWNRTKGELCREATEVLGVRGQEVLAQTVSCSSAMPGRDRDPSRFLNCGWCFPCLIRHASLEAAGGDATAYEINEGPVKGNGAASRPDRQALLQWLDMPFGIADLLAASPLPPEADLDSLMGVVHRSRRELQAVFMN